MISKLTVLILTVFTVGQVRAVPDLNIECPAYTEEVYDEQSVIDKFKDDIRADRIKSIHHK